MRRGARMKRREFITVLGGALTWASIAHAAPNAAIRAACHEDAKRLCVNAFGNPEAVRTCMREHHEQLSDKCKATIAKVKRGGNSAQGKNPQSAPAVVKDALPTSSRITATSQSKAQNQH